MCEVGGYVMGERVKDVYVMWEICEKEVYVMRDMKKCNGTGLVLKICETKNNVWKKYRLSIQNSIDNHIKITYIKPNFASLNSFFKK